MELETQCYLFFLIIWSFGLQLILTFSSKCFNGNEGLISFAIYMFFTITYCVIRYFNYKNSHGTTPTRIIYDYEPGVSYNSYGGIV